MRSRARYLAALLLAPLVILGACDGGNEADPGGDAAPEATEAPKCPLTGLDVPGGVDPERPAVAVKIENNPVAYPLSGLEDAEVVFEEKVEGDLTRFMAIYHCTDAKKAGPVRSARIVDAAIMSPITLIMANAGGNEIVRKELDKTGIITIDEDAAGRAMRRIERAGVSLEHTLYGNTVALRKLGAKKFDDPPPADLFTFGDAAAEKGKRTKKFTLNFSPSRSISYRWSGKGWLRSDNGQPLKAEGGGQIEVDNVIIEQHEVNFSRQLVDVAGNASIDIADPTGSGVAILFRDARMFKGRWKRKSLKDPVVYTTKAGAELALAPGTTWIELLPNNKGEVKGSFTIGK